MTSACFCRTELQRVYDTEATTMRALALRYDVATSTLCKWFRALRITRHKRGGNYGRGHAERMKYRAENRANGDTSLRVRPVLSLPCLQGRTDARGQGLRCIFTEDNACGQCERGEQAVRIEAGIRGGSLAPMQVAGW